MKKERSLKIINQLRDNIEKKLSACKYHEEIYIKSWVIGSLNMIEKKINDSWYCEDSFYDLFTDLMNHYMCINIDTKILIYVAMILWNEENRNLIVDLFSSLFTERQIEKMLNSTHNFIGFTLSVNKCTENEKYYLIRFEELRRYFAPNHR